MSGIAQLASELRGAGSGVPTVAAKRLERVAAYHAELDRLGLTANVFDYAAVIEILEGADLELPTDKDR